MGQAGRGRRTVQGEIEGALRTVTRSGEDDVRADRGGADRCRGACAGAGGACGSARGGLGGASGEAAEAAGRAVPEGRAGVALRRGARRDSTRGSPRCGGATSTGSATGPAEWTRCCAAMCSGTTGSWTSPRWTRPPSPWSGTRLRGVREEARGGDDDPRRSSTSACGDGRTGSSRSRSGPTPSVTTRCGPWWVSCCSWGTAPGREWPRKVLDAGVRDSAVHVVRPHGLTLEEVAYPADGLLVERQRQARRMRVLGQ